MSIIKDQASFVFFADIELTKGIGTEMVLFSDMTIGYNDGVVIKLGVNGVWTIDWVNGSRSSQATSSGDSTFNNNTASNGTRMKLVAKFYNSNMSINCTAHDTIRDSFNFGSPTYSSGPASMHSNTENVMFFDHVRSQDKPFDGKVNRLSGWRGGASMVLNFNSTHVNALISNTYDYTNDWLGNEGGYPYYDYNFMEASVTEGDHSSIVIPNGSLATTKAPDLTVNGTINVSKVY